MTKTMRSAIEQVLAIAVLTLLPVVAWAQSATTGAIAGVAKDPSGAVLPGVTVEVASPALIERVRTQVTDGRGQYRVADLRPGTYTVTFSLEGFATLKHDQLELNTGVTLAVNADMQLAGQSDEIVVTGAAPVVDLQSTATQNVMTQTVLQALPQAGTIQGFMSLTLGATIAGAGVPDVGGNKGEQTADISIHDSRPNDGRLTLDGMSFASGLTAGGMGQRSFVVNKISTQEVTIMTGSGGAEQETSGANLNIVPREGGNTFRGSLALNGASRSMQSTNVTDELRARGMTDGQNIRKIYDFGVAAGGPVVRDKLWFWSGFGSWGSQETAPGNYFNKTQGSLFYTPDLDRPAYTDTWNRAVDLRLTWQAAAKHKITFSETYEDFCLCFARVDLNNQAPEAANNNHNKGIYLTQANWNYTKSDKLLFQVGYTAALAPGRENERSPGVSKSDIPITEQSTGFQYNAFQGLGQTAYGKPDYNQMNGRAIMSYVTGTHAVRAGFTWQRNDENYDNDINSAPGIGPVSYVFRTATPGAMPTPVSITQYASPHHSISRSWVTALYLQDQWTLSKLTLNLGVRYDATYGYAPAQTAPESYFTPSLSFPRLGGIPNFKDINPRFGFAYDLFGNGRTAIKASMGRYVVGDYTTTTVANNPAEAIVTSSQRAWNDANGNYIPDCDLHNTAQNGECGALANNGFGTVRINTTYDKDVLQGWYNRPYNWSSMVALQHQLTNGVGLSVAYYRTSYGNFRVTQNAALEPTDFDEYCIDGPTDSRVGSLNGARVCGFHDVSPAKFGQVQNVVTDAAKFGGQSQVYNGVDVALNARFGSGGIINSGLSVGQTVMDVCAIAQNYPNVTATINPAAGSTSFNANTPSDFCHVAAPWTANSQAKIAVSYPLPWWGLNLAMTYQNLPGIPINTNYVASNAEIAKSLGRNLAACGTSVNCTTSVTLNTALYAPFTEYEDRMNQVDVRFSKVVKLGGLSFKGSFDLYNVFNEAAILAENTTYSSTTSYLLPRAILGPRLFKLGLNIDW